MCERAMSHQAAGTSSRWHAAVSLRLTAPSSSLPMRPQLWSHSVNRRTRTAAAVGAARAVQTAATSAAAYAKSMDDGFKYFELELPPPVNSRVKKADFVRSSTKTADCPKDKKHEFAVIGRSNVGKSSLINSLAESKGLARTSKNPGASPPAWATHTQPSTHSLPHADKQMAACHACRQPPSFLCNTIPHRTPHAGMTRLINHYLINDVWYLVDLPGYG